MKKTYLFLSSLFIIYSSINLRAQESSAYGGAYYNKNNIYGDAGFGIVNLAIVLRFNYERQVFQKKSLSLMGRTGIAYWSDWTAFGVEVPLTLQAIFFKSSSHLELGIGASWYTNIADGGSKMPVMFNFGYRFQNQDRDFLFRLNAEYSGNHLIPMVSFGKSF